ncbi:DUF1700 domain-containing protein [Actinokineospora sp. UTMC 2448]|uniref:DUF1700 domain-containing protein n=1 Tax=Actinokineospora sp. UTMC 2448 TaxID=2268449 RepID=UPI00216429E0|nr:hypothetical protein [Actinokineospora sp. UTMC 2448]UVS78779.1 putative membrane protein [Actinokineospora sp. UTMC 2448]
MNDIVTRPEVAEYLRRVRAGLTGLPDEEVAEVMEDLAPHVDEVYAEAGSLEAVVDRLGTPEEYAAELRRAGGYPVAQDTQAERPRTWRARYVVWAAAGATVAAGLSGVLSERYDEEALAVALLCGLALLPALWLVFAGMVRRVDVESVPEYRLARDQARRAVRRLPSPERVRALAPGWRVARLLLVALGCAAAVRADAGLWMVALLGAAGVLLWAGRRVAVDRRLLLVVVPANALAIGLGLSLAVQAVDASGRDNGYYYPVSVSTGLSYNGEPLGNLYAVDGEGKEIPEFYLYDEHGIPLNVYQYGCSPTNGELFDNRFPAPNTVYGPDGCVEQPGMPFVPLPPNGTTTAPTTTAPTTTAPTSTGPTTAAPTTTGPTSAAPTSTASVTTTPSPTTTKG